MFRDIENLLDTWLEMIEAQSPRTLSKSLIPKKSWPGSIEQDDECVFITIDLPGFDKKNLKLKVNEDHVSVKAEQDERKHSSSKALPCPVDPSTAKATYRNGVLDIKVYKVEVTKGVNVSIK